MNYVKYSHCSALKLRPLKFPGEYPRGVPAPQSYIFIGRSKDAESKESVKQEDANGKAEGKG